MTIAEEKRQEWLVNAAVVRERLRIRRAQRDALWELRRYFGDKRFMFPSTVAVLDATTRARKVRK
jgi:hypothetical protein